MKPVHKHDCEKCQYVVTSLKGIFTKTDWYVCGNPSGMTIVGRRSDEGSDYWSMDKSVVLRALHEPRENGFNEELMLAAYVYQRWLDQKAFERASNALL